MIDPRTSANDSSPPHHAPPPQPEAILSRPSPRLIVAHFSKSYRDFVAVSDLTFTVEPGHVLGLVGPNGAGKTTTMRSIAGIIAPTSGRITITGFDLKDHPLEAKGTMAYVPDDPKLFESLTVREHLQFIAQAYRVNQYESRADRLLDRFELTEKENTLAQELSRGMRQKVAITCALLHSPTLLMLDEPMTGLDPRGIRTMKSMLRDEADNGAAVIISSHLLALVEDLCTDLLILHKGQSQYCGSLARAREMMMETAQGQANPTLEELFFRITEGAEAPRDTPTAAPDASADPAPIHKEEG